MKLKKLKKKKKVYERFGGEPESMWLGDSVRLMGSKAFCLKDLCFADQRNTYILPFAIPKSFLTCKKKRKRNLYFLNVFTPESCEVC